MTSRAERSAASEAAFRSRLEAVGALLLEQAWLGVDAPHAIRCQAGHEVTTTPSNAKRAGEICRICSRRDPATTEAEYREHLAALGATPLWDNWRGGHQSHRVRCAQGHDCYPLWINVQRGTGICRACAGQDPATAEKAFRDMLVGQGAVLVGSYVNARQPVHVRCPAGHDCYPMPDNVRRGQGICTYCAGREWDVFYVLGHGSEPVVKFGITSRQGRTRLAGHRRVGFTRVHLLTADLPERVAREAENAVKAALGDAGELPVRGTEYFDVSCLGLILDVAGHWLNASEERLVS